MLERWLSNNLGLLTAEEFKVLDGLLKPRWVRWLTGAAQRVVTCPQSQSKVVTKLGKNRQFPSLALVVHPLASPSQLQFHHKRDNAEGGVVTSSKFAKRWGVK